MSKIHLKIKLKSLAAEARIIRMEEKKSHGLLRNSLHLHRVFDVRGEARHTQLAYAYLNGKRYRDIERTCHISPSNDRIRRMVEKYGDGIKFDQKWLMEIIPEDIPSSVAAA